MYVQFNQDHQKLNIITFTGGESLEAYVESELTDNRYTIVCPYPSCNTQWSWQLISHVINRQLFNQTQLQLRLANNYVTSSLSAKICPHCQAYIVRIATKNDTVKCSSCYSLLERTGNYSLSETKELQVAYDGIYKAMLCWKCLKICTKSMPCENCNGVEDPRIKYIINGGYISPKYFNGAVPQVRACPSCGILIQYENGCAHMTCTKCNHHFCIKCLRCYSSGSEHHRCKIAPMQTKDDLPNHQEVINDIRVTTKQNANCLSQERRLPNSNQVPFSELSNQHDFLLYWAS